MEGLGLRITWAELDDWVSLGANASICCGVLGNPIRSRKNVLVEMLMVESSYQGLGDALYLGNFERYPFLEVTKGVEINHTGVSERVAK
jgi:hypothetical protein